MENYKNTAKGKPTPMMENKFTTYQEYILFGDPALNLYEPVNNGQNSILTNLSFFSLLERTKNILNITTLQSCVGVGRWEINQVQIN